MSQATSQTEANWKKFLNAFGYRKWSLLRGGWCDFDPVVGPGQPPLPTLSGYLQSSGVMPGELKNRFTDTESPRESIPGITLSEAFYWLHKAIHVLGAAESNIQAGCPTWSLSSAYQAAYFAARSILGLLGVSTGELGRITVATDICRNIQGTKPQRLQELGPFLPDAHFRSPGFFFQQSHIWQLFQRVLRVSDIQAVPSDWTNFIIGLDSGDLTRQRHSLHYQVDYWVLDDMSTFQYPDDFMALPIRGTGSNLYDHTKPEFNLCVATLLIQFGLRLSRELAEVSQSFNLQHCQFGALALAARHPFYSETLLSEFYV